MRVRDFAAELLRAERLEDKLRAPPYRLDLVDDQPPLRIDWPHRPANLTIQRQRVVVPPLEGMRDPAQRARIIHALANHELQAVELFAWALLAFPAAPLPFRTGLLGILVEEQRHLGLYLERLAAHGMSFGDVPVTGHFWTKLGQMSTPLGFVCAMGLTFENANLDFANDYARAARAAGDVATALVIEQVHADEIGHVRFAWTWLKKLCPDVDPWQAYLDALEFPLGPARARGREMDREARRRAGLSEAFIASLEAVEAKRPSGRPR